jgi:hypothetical protein
MKRKYLLQKHQQYYFYILYNVHPESIARLNFKPISVMGMSMTDLNFPSLVDEIAGLSDIFTEYQASLQQLWGVKLSYLFYSKNEDSLINLISLLSLIKPSGFYLWISFETLPTDLASIEPECHNRLGTFSEYKSIYECFDLRKKGDLFFLIDHEAPLVNLLIRHFDKLSKTNESMPELLALYGRAYAEEAFYFKYLLFFMIIESLIKDDENTGVVYKIRRMCAVLAGEDIAQCTMIYKGVGEAYKRRSSMVHSAKIKIDREYLLFVHALVCEILLLMLLSGITKDQIFAISTKMAFGQRIQLIKNIAFRRFWPLMINQMHLVYPFPKAPASSSKAKPKSENS